MNDRRPVLAAVDGSSGSNAALRYAAERAHVLGRPLDLVHVSPTFLPAAGMGALGAPYLPEEFADVGRDILDDAATVARGLLPGEDVRTHLVSGSATAGLVQAANHAYEIVLGADHMPLIARIAVGSAVSGVASGSQVPVIVVPDYWTASAPGDARIVVAIQHYEHPSAELLRASFELGVEHGARLEFVHVWDLPRKYAEVVDSLTDYPAWQTAVRHMIERAAAQFAAEFPTVRYSVTAMHGQPVPMLREAAAEARLLVLAREAHHAPHFGHVGRTLLRVSACPVEVIPLRRPVAAPDHPETPEADADDHTSTNRIDPLLTHAAL